MGAKLERTTFHTSRAAEYFYARELEAQTGQPQKRFRQVALKELVDNALDSAEVVSSPPEVTVQATVDLAYGSYELTVVDNGGGIEEHVVERTLDFNTRTSDKALYRTPTRGQQGNALKTIVAMPFALGEEDPLLVVQAHGVRHHIRALLGAGDFPDIQRDPREVEKVGGTLVKVRLPCKANPYGLPGKSYTQGTHHHDLVHAKRMMRAYHLFNPQALVTFGGSVRGIDQG